ncbi:type-2 ice-structuring protein-like [Archocentrus centrarchus]|uniref:type-2 ice-structuring protein-like n=1 Tax=Archocentrus centrarchus TaxID=63155 RepID=UPI0011E9C826|nr:type-2 ice-structuring protein-like [Archocentrus centrarchus]
MKLLTAAVLLCAMMALTTAAAEYCSIKCIMTCPYGWKKFGKRCFLYVIQALSWAQAQRNCDHMDANLASAHSFKEYKFIQHLIFTSSHTSKEAWLGGSDAQEVGYWFWIDGTQFRYMNWCPGQPSNYYSSERCLQMNYSDHKCWDDTYCSTLLPSVCVKNI